MRQDQIDPFAHNANKFSEASVHFNQVLEKNPADLAARIYLKRFTNYMVNGVPPDWTGVETPLKNNGIMPLPKNHEYGSGIARSEWWGKLPACLLGMTGKKCRNQAVGKRFHGPNI
jgi:hypothetical protein